MLWYQVLTMDRVAGLQTAGGFTIVDFTIPTRDSPIIHPSATAPICEEVGGLLLSTSVNRPLSLIPKVSEPRLVFFRSNMWRLSGNSLQVGCLWE